MEVKLRSLGCTLISICKSSHCFPCSLVVGQAREKVKVDTICDPCVCVCVLYFNLIFKLTFHLQDVGWIFPMGDSLSHALPYY